MANKTDEFDWIKLRQDYENNNIETTKDKFVRKLKEQPLVPIGCLATLGALSYGLWSFRQGRREMSQYMMRARILAQGFTVVALIVGVTMSMGQPSIASADLEKQRKSTQ